MYIVLLYLYFIRLGGMGVKYNYRSKIKLIRWVGKVMRITVVYNSEDNVIIIRMHANSGRAYYISNENVSEYSHLNPASRRVLTASIP